MLKVLAPLSLLLAGMSMPALATEGTAVGVDPEASAASGSTVRTLVVGADVAVGDRITTGPQGRVQLFFDDQTRIVVGPGSTLQIETYLLNGSGAGKVAVNALAGTFRFISGTSPKPVYSIDTPTASIAIRGTKFDVTVSGDTSGVMLFEGALTICRGASCVDLVRRCDIAIVSAGEAVRYQWSDPDRASRTSFFPLPNIQAAFLPEFRVQGSQACLGTPAPGSNDSLASPGAGGVGTVTEPAPQPGAAAPVIVPMPGRN